VWGGSRGAHSINVAISRALDQLLDLCQIVHLCGPDDEPWLQELRADLPQEKRLQYFLYAYLHEELPAAMAASDLAVSRSGASVLGEFPAAGLPSILIPYPFAGGHQKHNAALLQNQGAARVIEERDIEELLPVIKSLLTDNLALQEMGESARRMDRPGAAKRIACLLSHLGSGSAEANGANHLKEAPWKAK